MNLLVNIKRWMRNIKKVIAIGDLALVFLTALYVLASNSYTTSMFPFSDIAKLFEGKIAKYIRKRNLAAEFYGLRFYFPDLSALTILDEEYEKETFNLLNGILTNDTLFVDIGLTLGNTR